MQRSLVNAMIDERRWPWRRREQSLPVLTHRTGLSSREQPKVSAGYGIASHQQAYLSREREDAKGSDPGLCDDEGAVGQNVDAGPTGGDAVTVGGKPATW